MEAALKKEAPEGLFLEGESIFAVDDLEQPIVHCILCIGCALSEVGVVRVVDLLAVGLNHVHVVVHLVVLLCVLFCLGSCYNGQTTTMRFCK